MKATSKLTGKILVNFIDAGGNSKWHIVNSISEVVGEVLYKQRLGVVDDE